MTQKFVDASKTSQEPQGMARKAGELVKTGPSSSLLEVTSQLIKDDQVQERAIFLGEEEDMAASQKGFQEPGIDNFPREEVLDLGPTKEENERENKEVIGSQVPEVNLVSTRDGATRTGTKEDLVKDMDQMVDHLSTPKKAHKAYRSLQFKN